MYLNNLNNRAVSPTCEKGFAPFWQKDLGLNGKIILLTISQ